VNNKLRYLNLEGAHVRAALSSAAQRKAPPCARLTVLYPEDVITGDIECSACCTKMVYVPAHGEIDPPQVRNLARGPVLASMEREAAELLKHEAPAAMQREASPPPRWRPAPMWCCQPPDTLADQPKGYCVHIEDGRDSSLGRACLDRWYAMVTDFDDGMGATVLCGSLQLPSDSFCRAWKADLKNTCGYHYLGVPSWNCCLLTAMVPCALCCTWDDDRGSCYPFRTICKSFRAAMSGEEDSDNCFLVWREGGQNICPIEWEAMPNVVLSVCILEACAIPLCLTTALATTVCRGPTAPVHLAGYRGYQEVRLWPFVYRSSPGVQYTCCVSCPMLSCVSGKMLFLPIATALGCPVAWCKGYKTFCAWVSDCND